MAAPKWKGNEKMGDNCYLGGHMNQCCCVCRHHKALIVRSDEAINYDRADGYVKLQVGWVCDLPILGGVFGNWPEHSIGCEMFDLWPYDKHISEMTPDEHSEKMDKDNYKKACAEFWKKHPRKEDK